MATQSVYISLSADIDNGAPCRDAQVSPEAGCWKRPPPLRFGQQVDVKIRTAFRPKVLKLPFGALINKDDKTWVAVISEQGRVKFLPVVTGIEDLTHTEILQGITAEQQVILPEGQTLNEDDRVRPALKTSP